jgi:hypothetical protein
MYVDFLFLHFFYYTFNLLLLPAIRLEMGVNLEATQKTKMFLLQDEMCIFL